MYQPSGYLPSRSLLSQNYSQFPHAKARSQSRTGTLACPFKVNYHLRGQARVPVLHRPPMHPTLGFAMMMLLPDPVCLNRLNP
jgi:hypothetical protein